MHWLFLQVIMYLFKILFCFFSFCYEAVLISKSILLCALFILFKFVKKLKMIDKIEINYQTLEAIHQLVQSLGFFPMSL